MSRKTIRRLMSPIRTHSANHRCLDDNTVVLCITYLCVIVGGGIVVIGYAPPGEAGVGGEL